MFLIHFCQKSLYSKGRKLPFGYHSPSKVLYSSILLHLVINVVFQCVLQKGKQKKAKQRTLWQRIEFWGQRAKNQLAEILLSNI